MKLLDQHVTKICHAANRIKFRGELRKDEKTRVQETYKALHTPLTKRNKTKAYWMRIQAMHQIGGNSLVMICIVGIGQKSISEMKEDLAMELPTKVMEKQDEWEFDIVRSIADDMWKACTPSFEQHIDVQAVEVADISGLRNILGDFLSCGLTMSHKLQNDNMKPGFTRAARLHLPPQQGDMILEVWLHSTFGECIRTVIDSSVDELRNLFGDKLFFAMKASEQRMYEERMAIRERTSAVDISDAINGDEILRVKVQFTSGIEIWTTAFPQL